MAAMQAAAWTDAGELRLEQRPRPQPGPGEVCVDPGSCGICGSDLHWFRGEFQPVTGLTPGHEIGGVISAVGRDVTGLKEGDVVGVEPLVRCGTCDLCQRGDYHICKQGGLIGIADNGGLAESVLAPAYAVFAAPTGVDAELAALAEPVACSVHAYEKVALQRGETVLILGAGSIGLTALLAARAYGAPAVITARYPHQREAALRLGAQEVLMDDETGTARLRELSRDGFDLVVEAVGGHADTIAQAVKSVRPLGRVAMLGVFTAAAVSFNPFLLLSKEAQIIGAVTYNVTGDRADYAMALDIVAQFPDETRSLITHRFGLADVLQAFETAMDKSTASIKVQVRPAS